MTNLGRKARVGWLADRAAVVGGAELTQAEFRAAAPDGVEIVDCPAGGVVADVDAVVIQNCVQYVLDDLEPLKGLPIVKYHHDVGPHMQAGVREWLAEHSTQVCCSPVQAEYMGLPDALLIPPPVDLARFAKAAESVNGDRRGAVSVGSWRNHGKAPHMAAAWGAEHGGVQFFGSGPFAPPESREVAYDDMPDLLAHFETFVHLPTVIEPFGRAVAEAWAAGCEIVSNRLVGATYWITENPEAIETAAEDFWKVVLAS